MPERRLTVAKLFAPAPRRSYPPAAGSVVPLVRISGRWLSELGFAPGDRVRVSAEPGRLVLTLAEPAAGGR